MNDENSLNQKKAKGGGNAHIKTLEEQKEKLDREIEDLERDYLAKIVKLLVMTQVHCEIKTDIYNEFDKLGVQTHVQEVEINKVQDPSFNNN